MPPRGAGFNRFVALAAAREEHMKSKRQKEVQTAAMELRELVTGNVRICTSASLLDVGMRWLTP